jgi:subtilase family serine protease
VLKGARPLVLGAAVLGAAVLGTAVMAMAGLVSGSAAVAPVTAAVAGWGTVGGTSEAGPLFAGIVALADQVAKHSLGYLNPALYALAARGGSDGIVPVSQGSNNYTFCPAAHLKSNSSCASSADLVTVPGFSANGSYNLATGWGTVDAALFVPALARAAG